MPHGSCCGMGHAGQPRTGVAAGGRQWDRGVKEKRKGTGGGYLFPGRRPMPKLPFHGVQSAILITSRLVSIVTGFSIPFLGCCKVLAHPVPLLVKET